MIIHPPYRGPLARALAVALVGALALAVALLAPGPQFVLPAQLGVALHTSLQLASVVVCLLVFAVGRATFDRSRGSLVPVVSSVFLAVGLLDFAHVLVAQGMPLHGAGAGLGRSGGSSLAARLVVALVLLAIAVMPWERPLRGRVLLALSGGSLAFALALAAWSLLAPRWAPLPSLEGVASTALGTGLELALGALHLGAAAAFVRRMDRPQSLAVVPLFAACGLLALSALCFSLQTTAGGAAMLLGHLLKVLAYLHVYLAIVGEAVRRPHEELARARQELERSEARYRLLFEHNTDAVVVLDRAGAVQDANPAARDLLGLGGPERGLRGHDLVDPDDTRLPALLEARAATGRARGELRVRRADGRIMEAEVSTVAYQDASGRTLFSWGVRDMTERHRAREQILQLNATLEQRVRRRTAELEALNRELESFSYTVAHDLRAPLGAIDGFSEALAALLADRVGEREQHYLERIRASARKMGEMIDALLELGRLSRSQLQPEPVDLAQLARTILDDLRGAAPQREVEVRIQGPLPVQGDRRLLRIALENLVGNAWKFTGRRADARIEVGQCGQRDGLPLFFVRDNGAGFDMAHAKRLFGAFQRLHSQAEFTGHGVGLATVSRIVQLHGGEIWADARPGVGATFYFTLARVAGTAEAAAAAGTVAA